MERTLTPEERIRRAEEIYNRRRTGNVRVSSDTVNNNATNISLKSFKKIIIQLLICILIYFIFYLIQDTNYVFSNDVLTRTREALSYDINFQNIYEQFLNMFVPNKDNYEIIPPTEDDETKENNNDENSVNEIIDLENINTENTLDGIGGGQSYIPLVETLVDDNTKDLEIDLSNLSQMEKDVLHVKKSYSFIKPVEGTVTSRFGARESNLDIISTNHTGIDLGATSGTVIYASMEGTVSFVSSESGYGNHFKITKDNVTTLYAHCKTVYVKEGDEVRQGDAVAEVGSTGNSTGPHLHFEVLLEDRYINPDYILEF